RPVPSASRALGSGVWTSQKGDLGLPAPPQTVRMEHSAATTTILNSGPSMAKITLAIPFYSGLAFLRRALDSVVRQTLADWQVVVSDDASPDAEARELVASYRDGRMRYCRNPVNLGMAGNWNRCLDLAETDLVTLLHADDELLDNYCSLI